MTCRFYQSPLGWTCINEHYSGPLDQNNIGYGSTPEEAEHDLNIRTGEQLQASHSKTFIIIASILAVAILVFALDCHGEDIPDAPSPMTHPITLQQITGIPKLQRETVAQRAVDYSFWFGVVAVHALDWTSTQQCLRRPYTQCHENQLPVALVSNKAGFALFKAGVAFAAIEGQRYLERHGHHRIAYASQSIHIGMVLAQDVSNYRLAAHDPRYEGGAR